MIKFLIMTKVELRKIYLQKRQTLSSDEVFLSSQKIFENFVLQFNPIDNQKVHVFQNIQKFNEINTKPWINYFFENKIRVFVPKMIRGKIISIEIFPDTEFKVNSWGISEPVSNEDSQEKDYDFILTPLLYCDIFGNRIGYGKGFYDQFFSEINTKKNKIGVSFFPPDEIVEDINQSDVKLDYLVLPTKVLSF